VLQGDLYLSFIKAATGTRKFCQVNVNLPISTPCKRHQDFNEILVTMGGLIFSRHNLSCIIIIIIIMMFLKGYACFLFLDPRDEVGPSISSSVVLCSFILLVYIVVLVLVVCLCPSSVHVVATFSGTVLFPLLCSVLPFFGLI